MKKRMSLLSLAAAFFLVAVSVLSQTGCKAPPDEEIKSLMEIVDIETKWVSKSYRPWPKPQLILVPTISFRIKNLSQTPLRFVNCNAIFKFKNDVENLGDNFLSAIRGGPVSPGGVSEKITLKSNFGVEGKNLSSFKNNPQWKTVYAKVYVQYRGSRHVLLGEWVVSREIDFKEPEPAYPEENKESPKK
ncbi:MAG: hypothetical protein WCC06_11110 [Candidatus Aminicenantales bacterium]